MVVRRVTAGAGALGMADRRPISVVLGDPGDLARAGLRALLADDPRFTIVGEAATDVVGLARRHRPDLIVLDPKAAGGVGPGLIGELHAASPESRLIIFADVVEPRAFLDLMLAGVRGYFLTGGMDADFAREALAFTGRFAVTVIDDVIAEPLRPPGPGTLVLLVRQPPADSLSPRESEVLHLLDQGYTDKEIADQLGIALSTVESHAAHLMAKFDVRQRTALGAAAVRRGFLPG